nr:hypothetical protein [Marinicella sp. W31]MDC2877345.1 hypothetical protein [Marinicella sp. W31]
MIAYQASKVRTFESAGHRLDADELRQHLSAFAQDLLDVLAGDVSLALNRLAIGRVTKDGQKLGRMLLERGRAQIDQRARALWKMAGVPACWFLIMATRLIVCFTGLSSVTVMFACCLERPPTAVCSNGARNWLWKGSGRFMRPIELPVATAR